MTSVKEGAIIMNDFDDSFNEMIKTFELLNEDIKEESSYIVEVGNNFGTIISGIGNLSTISDENAEASMQIQSSIEVEHGQINAIGELMKDVAKAADKLNEQMNKNLNRSNN